MSVAPPPQGLSSNFNYFLADGGNAITGLNVEITFAEPLISASNGFGFQLNGYARKEFYAFILTLPLIPLLLLQYSVSFHAALKLLSVEKC